MPRQPSQKKLLVWDPREEGRWDSPDEPSGEFSGTFPSSGTMRRGSVYALPTPEHPTSDSGSSFWHGRPEPLTPETAWAAGLFEGEGYISLRLDDRAPSVLLGMIMTDEDAVRRFYEIVKVGSMTGPYQQRGLGKKPFWRWAVGTFPEVEMLLNKMWDGLCSRRQAMAVYAMDMVVTLSEEVPPKGMLPTPQPPSRNGKVARPDLSLEAAARLLPTPTTRDWKDGHYQPNVPVNSLLGRAVWGLNGETEIED